MTTKVNAGGKYVDKFNGINGLSPAKEEDAATWEAPKGLMGGPGCRKTLQRPVSRPGVWQVTFRGNPQSASNAAMRYSIAIAPNTARRPNHMAMETPIIGARALAPELIELSRP